MVNPINISVCVHSLELFQRRRNRERKNEKQQNDFVSPAVTIRTQRTMINRFASEWKEMNKNYSNNEKGHRVDMRIGETLCEKCQSATFDYHKSLFIWWFLCYIYYIVQHLITHSNQTTLNAWTRVFRWKSKWMIHFCTAWHGMSRRKSRYFLNRKFGWSWKHFLVQNEWFKATSIWFNW